VPRTAYWRNTTFAGYLRVGLTNSRQTAQSAVAAGGLGWLAIIRTDPLGAIVLFGVPALLAAAIMAACRIPARRARVDATQALRQE
jgi:hypothetical protein